MGFVETTWPHYHLGGEVLGVGLSWGSSIPSILGELQL